MRPTRSMSAVERFLERLLERPTARIFRTRVQPVQLQRRIERAMEHGRVVDGRSTRVPDRFTVRLSARDLEALDPIPALPVQLASGALDWARHHGVALAARPRVALVGDRRLRPGDIEVEARFSAPGDRPAEGSQPDPAATRAFAAPVAPEPRATLAVHDSHGSRSIAVGGGSVAIGRTADNAIVLADSRVSRHHARLVARDGVLVLVDLESTNGTWVNGARIREVAVGAGDVIVIGDATIEIDGGAEHGSPGPAGNASE